jgi:hypothetical protein
MKRLIAFLLLLTSCAGQTSVLHSELLEPIKEENILIVVGEGGTSSDLFRLSALTYQRENGGVWLEANNGNDFVSGVNDFVSSYGQIDHLEYFGHGNNVALFLNQEPGVNGGLYANDPSYNEDYLAASIYDLNGDVFSTSGTVTFNGCNLAKDYEVGETFAQDIANHFQVIVTAAEGPTQFSSSPDAIIDFQEWRNLELDENDDVYMLPAYLDEAFVVLSPAAPSRSGYKDVYRGDIATGAIDWLTDQGAQFGDEFRPYAIASASDVLLICEALDLNCDLDSNEENQKTLNILAVLVDAHGLTPSSTWPWYNAYVSAAISNNWMIEGFTDRRWITRSDVAYLAYKLADH